MFGVALDSGNLDDGRRALKAATDEAINWDAADANNAATEPTSDSHSEPGPHRRQGLKQDAGEISKHPKREEQ